MPELDDARTLETLAASDLTTEDFALVFQGSTNKVKRVPASTLGDTVDSSDVVAAIADDPAAVSTALDMPNVNVRHYGAVGDGVADDTAEIQAAIDAAEAGSVKTVYFPAGTYKLTAALEIGANDIRIIGDGWTSVLNQTTASENGIEFSGVDESNNNAQIERLKITGVGAATSTGSGIASRKADGGYFQTGTQMYLVRVEGFANGLWAENLPLLGVNRCQFKNNLVGMRLTKCDTFVIQNSTSGAGGIPGETTYCFVIEGSSGTPAGPNFGGVILSGEYGQSDHFMNCDSGTVSIIEPNLELIEGSYITRIGSTGKVIWHSGRISTSEGTSAQAVFRLDCATQAPTLNVFGTINLSASGWRQIEAHGTYYYNAHVQSFTPLQLVYAATPGATAVATVLTTPTVTRRTDAAVNYGAAWRGLQTFRAIDDAQLGLDSLLVSARDATGTYARRNLINDSLLMVPTVNTTTLGTTGATEDTLHQESVAAYKCPGAGWSVKITAYGKFANNANAKRLRVSGQTLTVLFDSTSQAYQNSSWELEITIYHKSATASHVVTKFASDDPLATKHLAVYNDYARGFSQANTYEILGTGVSDADVVIHGVKTEILKNGSEF